MCGPLLAMCDSIAKFPINTVFCGFDGAVSKNRFFKAFLKLKAFSSSSQRKVLLSLLTTLCKIEVLCLANIGILGGELIIIFYGLIDSNSVAFQIDEFHI